MRTIFFLLIALTGTAYAGESAVPFDPVFECHRINTAWGFAMSGAAIARDGSVAHYALRDKDLRPVPQKEDGVVYFDASSLRAHLAEATTASKVDATQLQSNLALVIEAAKGKVSGVSTGVRDAGVSTCHAYIFDSEKNRYRDVELGSDGAVTDVRFENDAKAAATLREWLVAVGVATK